MSEAQAIFFRRRHQARRPPVAKIRPGRPAPAMGPGTGALSPVTKPKLLVPVAIPPTMRLNMVPAVPFRASRKTPPSVTLVPKRPIIGFLGRDHKGMEYSEICPLHLQPIAVDLQRTQPCYSLQDCWRK